MRSLTAQLRESISSRRTDSLTARRLKDSGKFTNAKASRASTAEQRFAAPRTAADRLTGVRSARRDDHRCNRGSSPTVNLIHTRLQPGGQTLNPICENRFNGFQLRAFPSRLRLRNLK